MHKRSAPLHRATWTLKAGRRPATIRASSIAACPGSRAAPWGTFAGAYRTPVCWGHRKSLACSCPSPCPDRSKAQTRGCRGSSPDEAESRSGPAQTEAGCRGIGSTSARRGPRARARVRTVEGTRDKSQGRRPVRRRDRKDRSPH